MAPPETSHNQTATFQSPGKINLFLEVTGRRPDGYHELETVMVRTSLCDTLQLTARDDGAVTLELAGIGGLLAQAARTTPAPSLDFPLDESNLIMRAARALQSESGCRQGASIRICKRIPGQAGLGGGSGNAAVTLTALNRLWNLQLPTDVLHRLAATLGSDVNFLLSGYRAAFCSGRGERIQPLPVRGLRHGLLLVPFQGNATSEVFSALTLPRHPLAPTASQRQLASNNVAAVHCFNRLQEAAEAINPHVHRAITWLQQHAGNGYLTGSGSGCFALLRTPAVSQQLLKSFPGDGLASATTFCF